MSQMRGQLPKVKHAVHFNKMLGAASRRNQMDSILSEHDEADNDAGMSQHACRSLSSCTKTQFGGQAGNDSR